MSDANSMSLAYAKEGAGNFGVAPGGTYQKLRFTGESLKQTTGTVTSQEIVEDGQVSDVIRNALSADGDINVELSYGTFDDFFDAFLMAGGWSTIQTASGTDISVGEADDSFNQTGGFTNFVANQWIHVSGFTGTGSEIANGFHKIATKTNDKITVYTDLTTDDPGGESVTIKMMEQVVDGTATMETFHFEKEFTDLSNEFILDRGMALDGIALTVSVDQIVTGTFSFIGKDEISATATDSTSKDAVTTTQVMNAIDHVISVLEANADYGITGFTIQGRNNLRARLQVATLGAISIGRGTRNMTGTVTAYFTVKTKMDKYRNFTATSIAIVFQDDAGNGYVMDFPRIKFTSGQQVATGINTDILEDLGFTAYKHETEGITWRVARLAA